MQRRIVRWPWITLALAVLLVQATPSAAEFNEKQSTDAIREYLRRTTVRRTEASQAHVRSLKDWQDSKEELRRQLLDMLGLWPLPAKGELHPVITGTIARYGIVVEKLHFQSRPGLYVTANFYRPEAVSGKLPTILYLCGHGRVKTGDVSFGNKVHYHHHAVWFAKHGYCCLVIDTLQLGEIEGIHHGTHNLGRWWWVSRGYTPAGVEAWNAVRALDYLATRPEVDMENIGVTGRSGGGAYTWWIAAIDDRPQCLVPVAGTTDLENHVVDNCIKGHCDCMFMVNHHGWDFPMVNALAAPRPLLFSNTDKDVIFPLSGVQRSHHYVATLYGLYKKPGNLGLLVTEGPHNDTQDLQVPAFRWMNRWLRQSDELIREPAEKLFTPHELKVFAELPADEKNTTIDQTFVPTAIIPPPPTSLQEWEARRSQWLAELGQRSFAGWPTEAVPLEPHLAGDATHEDIRMRRLDITTDENLRFPIFLVSGAKHPRPELLIVTVADDATFAKWQSMLGETFPEIGSAGKSDVSEEDAAELRSMLDRFAWCFAIVAPRGWGPNRWISETKANTHLLRSFVLLGKTADDGRIWDVRRAITALREEADFKDTRLWIQGEGQAAGIALYAGIYEPAVERFDLHELLATHAEHPILMSVLRTFDVPQALAMAFPRKVVLYGGSKADWEWTQDVARIYDAEKPPLQFRNAVHPAVSAK